MPVVLQAGYLLKTRAVCAGSGQYAMNVRHWRVSGVAGASATDLDVAVTLGGIFGPLYKNLIANTTSYFGFACQVISPPPLPVEQNSKVGAAAGTAGAEGLPVQVAGLSKIRTNLAGRPGRGFLYAPFPAELDSDGAGIPSAAYLAKLTALMNAWTSPQTIGAGGNTATLTPIIFGQTTGSVTDVIGFTNRTVWSNQKRRSLIRRADQAPF